MKRISLFLITAILFTSLGMLFVSANGTDPGTIAFQHTNESLKSWVVSYEYADDATAVQWGAIAKFTNVSNQETNYLKSWGAIGAFGNENGWGCGDTITLIGDSANKIALPSTETSFDVSGRSFTIDGNGVTVEGAGRLTVSGKAAATLTLKNFKISNTSDSGVSAMQIQGGFKVILDNSTVENVKAPQYAALVNKASRLVLTNGSCVKTGGAPTKDYSSNGVYLMDTAPTLEVNDGTSIVAQGIAISSNDEGAVVTVKGGLVRSAGGTSELRKDAISACSNVVISGGIVEAVYGRALHAYGSYDRDNSIVTKKANAVINGGILRSGGGYATIHSDCTSEITVNGGLITTTSDSVKLGVALAMTGSKSTPGGKLTVNGGTFYYANATEGAPMLKSHESADSEQLVVINGGDFVGSPYIFNGNLYEGSMPKVTLDKPFTYTGASVRTATDSTGLRFRSLITKASVDAAEALKKQGTSVKYGTLIVPTEYLDATGGIFTRSALRSAKKSVADIPAVNGIETQSNGDIIISAALVDMYEENFARDFSAVAYITVEAEHGTVTVYGTYNKEKNSRSAEEVAYAALADVKTASAGYYTTAVSEWYELSEGKYVLKTGTAYSPYSASQIAVIKTYIASAKGGNA